ncbi:hypothetical protein BB561_004764 [Smittium simulii]|uniref:Uncharacterized protein n=1 Tax=Smittium simulii TaxID=133385 RepID=A0A2T9YEE0_9FUNG|nr:hypothetical protein BB561_004764 [Smittium simulii]
MSALPTFRTDYAKFAEHRAISRARMPQGIPGESSKRDVVNDRVKEIGSNIAARLLVFYNKSIPKTLTKSALRLRNKVKRAARRWMLKTKAAKAAGRIQSRPQKRRILSRWFSNRIRANQIKQSKIESKKIARKVEKQPQSAIEADPRPDPSLERAPGPCPDQGRAASPHSAQRPIPGPNIMWHAYSNRLETMYGSRHNANRNEDLEYTRGSDIEVREMGSTCANSCLREQNPGNLELVDELNLMDRPRRPLNLHRNNIQPRMASSQIPSGIHANQTSFAIPDERNSQRYLSRGFEFSTPAAVPRYSRTIDNSSYMDTSREESWLIPERNSRDINGSSGPMLSPAFSDTSTLINMPRMPVAPPTNNGVPTFTQKLLALIANIDYLNLKTREGELDSGLIANRYDLSLVLAADQTYTGIRYTISRDSLSIDHIYYEIGYNPYFPSHLLQEIVGRSPNGQDGVTISTVGRKLNLYILDAHAADVINSVHLSTRNYITDDTPGCPTSEQIRASYGGYNSVNRAGEDYLNVEQALVYKIENPSADAPQINAIKTIHASPFIVRRLVTVPSDAFVHSGDSFFHTVLEMSSNSFTHPFLIIYYRNLRLCWVRFEFVFT